jgi:hypothetical protein
VFKRIPALAAVLAALAAVIMAATGLASGHATGGRALFFAGADAESFSPPAAGAIPSDPADCLKAADAKVFTGPRQFAFEEPYVDQHGDGHYDLGDPFLDCNHDGRWDGNYLGGGGNSPRFYDHVADPVGARAVVVSNGRRTVAMEVVDQEGFFNVYADRIRARVAADGYRIDNIQISATHDESAPDSLGLGGPQTGLSGTDEYWVNYLIAQSARAIERADAALRPAHVRYAEALEPANLRQCWSSYPFIDNPAMPVMQAVGTNGKVIATLASVSQHTESLGFNGGSQKDPGTPYTLDQENHWVSADWPYWFRTALEHTYGGVGIEMAGTVGSVETPEVFNTVIPRTPQNYVDESHPAGCRTLFDAPAGATKAPLGYFNETRDLGQTLASAVESALDHGSAWSRSNKIWARTVAICVPVDNVLFKVAAIGGTFAERPAYLPGCKVGIPAAPTGQTAGTHIKSEVAAWRIGDGEFIGAPGEVFPFTFLRGPVGPQDMNYPQYGMPAWPLPYMHTPWRFFDGLDNDMIGYIFPRGNDAGVPGQNLTTNPTASGTDRFGCGHSDDSEAVSDTAGDIIGNALVSILQHHGGAPERIVEGRFVLPDGKLSRNPLGTTDTIKCDTAADKTFNADGPAVAVYVPGTGVVHPAEWLDLLGRPQATPDRDTRGYIDAHGHRVWLDTFPDRGGLPASVKVS